MTLVASQTPIALFKMLCMGEREEVSAKLNDFGGASDPPASRGYAPPNIYETLVPHIKVDKHIKWI